MESVPDIHFDLVKYITHPISLIAYLCALVATYLIVKNNNERKMLAANPKAYERIAERIHVDLRRIPENQRAKIVMRMLRNRILGQIIIGTFITIIFMILAAVVIINGNKEEKNSTTRNDSLSEDKTQIPIKVTREAPVHERAQIGYLISKADEMLSENNRKTSPELISRVCDFQRNVITTINNVEGFESSNFSDEYYEHWEHNQLPPDNKSKEEQGIRDSIYVHDELKFHTDLLKRVSIEYWPEQ